MLVLRPREHRGAGAGNRAAERAGCHRCPAHFGKSRDQRLALRLDDHVLERRADHVEVVGVAAGDEAGEIRRLPDEVRHVDGAAEDGARLLGREEHVRMQDHRLARPAAPESASRADGRCRRSAPGRRTATARCCRRAASRSPPLRPASRTSAARACVHGLFQQRIRRDHRAHRGGGRAAEAGAERNALVDLHLEAESRAAALPAAPCSARPAVFFSGSSGRSPATPRDGADDDARLLAARHRDAIAQRIDRKAEDVESDGDVADRSRRERGGAMLITAALRDRPPGAADRRTRRRP